MITITEYLMGRDKDYPLSDKLIANAHELLKRVNQLGNNVHCPIKLVTSSGYRPGHYNTDAGGSPKSAHVTCEAIDIADPECVIDNWLTDDILKTYDLYREHPAYTNQYCHLTTRAPKSRRRTFIP